MNDLIKQETEQLKGLEESKAKQIKAVFQPMVEMLEGFEEEYKNVMALKISPEKCKEAKKLRIAVAKVRINADKVRADQKAEYIRAGNAIQGVYNILKFAVTDKEEKLKDVETHYEKIEEEKINRLQADREIELRKYDMDMVNFIDLGNMPDDIWTNYLAGVKNNFEVVKEAERKAEADRIEAEKKEAEERARIEAENEQLKIDAEKAEKLRIAEQKKIAAERKKQEAKLKAEREKAEAESKKQADILKAEQDKAAAERLQHETKLKTEREAREKLEREAKEKADREAAELKKAAKAPDKEKLFSVATKLRNTKTTVKSPEAVKALEDAALLIEKVAGGM